MLTIIQILAYSLICLFIHTFLVVSGFIFKINSLEYSCEMLAILKKLLACQFCSFFWLSVITNTVAAIIENGEITLAIIPNIMLVTMTAKILNER